MRYGDSTLREKFTNLFALAVKRWLYFSLCRSEEWVARYGILLLWELSRTGSWNLCYIF